MILAILYPQQFAICVAPYQRRIFILGALGYFKWGPSGRQGGCSHIFSRRRIRSCSNIFESGSEKFSNPTPFQQWRMQKIFTGVSFSGRWWPFVFGVRCLWPHNLTSYSCFQAKFADIIDIFFYTHSPCFCKKSRPIHLPYNKVFVK